MHFRNAGGATGNTESELAFELEAWWRSSIRAHQSASLNLHHIMVQNLDAQAAPGVLVQPAAPTVGAVAGTFMPNNVTVAISLRTGLSGRSFRGRVYHCGLASSYILNNSIQPSLLPNILTGYRNLILPAGNVPTAGFELVVLSYYANKAVRAAPVPTPVTAMQSDGILDSQRRRLPGRGR